MATQLQPVAQIHVGLASPGAVHQPAGASVTSPIDVLIRAFIIGLGLGIVLIAGPAEVWSVAAVGLIAIGSALLSWTS